MPARVVITGIGLVTPLGVGTKHVWKQLIAGKSGLVSTSTLKDERFNDIPSKVVGVVPLGDLSEGKWNAEEHLEKTEIRRTGKFSQFALAAAKEALTDARWFPESLEDQLNTGVCIGSGIGGIEEVYDNSVDFATGGYRKVQPLFVPKLLPNMAGGLISIKYGLKGPNHSVSTACATGNHSIGDAYRFIKDGYAKVILAGAAEASVHPVALAGFARAKSLVTKYNDDPTQASRPFDKDRDGFVLGEGAGLVVLEDLEHAKKRGANIYAEIVGYGLSGDAYHMTAPSPDGVGASRSMEVAVRGIDKHKINYINAHATSTNIGDRIESLAIKTTFKDSYKKNLHVSSTKGATGHLLGAAGSVESIFTILAVQQNVIPPTLNLNSPGGAKGDPSDGFDLNYVANESIEAEVNYALSNSFGFGGTNTSLTFKKYVD
jgi:3-oxoacyl-[acyl-carrier-protein] synthase II